MTTEATTAADGRRKPKPAFRTVLCGVDRSRADAETTRQAALLAGPGRLDLVCVWYGVGTGLAGQATLTEDHARVALENARGIASEICPDVHTAAVLATDPVEALLEEGTGHDLVVVGSHDHHRSGGIMLGSVATNLAHRLAVPLLVTRLAEESFPRHILLASDGSGSAHTAARLAARVARQHGATVTLVHAGDRDDARHRKGLAEDSAELFEQLGVEPVTVYERGDPAEAIVRIAAAEDASMVVLGSRGLTGVKAFGSVSERVVHEAPCSVLVARHP